ncbi:hypothetical protein EVG20_g9710 [Dentipellis fragilis]|uniref:Uncharacterized protein n=1 Tax=Dentipellis fragilis TaxID=205917 RepID=A0A4Y9XXB9_9AGAM|nr:hypothetical protein EVG20_g9710 [Dentipellis fragilis]
MMEPRASKFNHHRRITDDSTPDHITDPQPSIGSIPLCDLVPYKASRDGSWYIRRPPDPNVLPPVQFPHIPILEHVNYYLVRDMVQGGGRFLGSSSTRFAFQTAGDLYLQHYWQPVPPGARKYRILHTCIYWGMAVDVVERKDQNADPWDFVFADEDRIEVTRFGQVSGPEELEDLVPMPFADQEYFTGQGIRSGHAIPWNHHCVVKKPYGDHRLHYHRHKRRTNHGPIPPDIIHPPRGSHRSFKKLTYSSQVQNFRRYQN